MDARCGAFAEKPETLIFLACMAFMGFLAWPTRVKSALNTVDGASAYIISSESEARKNFAKEPIKIEGFHWSSSNYYARACPKMAGYQVRFFLSKDFISPS